MKRVLFLSAVALVAFAGVAYAAGTITGKSIKDNTITGKDIKNKSLSKSDFRGSVRGPRGATGPQGAAGPAGPAGPTVVGQITQVDVTFQTGPGAINSASAVCPAGQRIISGGYFTDAGFAFIDKTYDRVSWSVGIDNSDSMSVTSDTTITASCAPAGQAVAASTGFKRRAALARDVARRKTAR